MAGSARTLDKPDIEVTPTGGDAALETPEKAAGEASEAGRGDSDEEMGWATGCHNALEDEAEFWCVCSHWLCNTVAGAVRNSRKRCWLCAGSVLLSRICGWET